MQSEKTASEVVDADELPQPAGATEGSMAVASSRGGTAIRASESHALDIPATRGPSLEEDLLTLQERDSTPAELVVPARKTKEPGVVIHTYDMEQREIADRLKQDKERTKAMTGIVRGITGELSDAKAPGGHSRGTLVAAGIKAVSETTDVPNRYVNLPAYHVAVAAPAEFARHEAYRAHTGGEFAAALDAMGEPGITRPLLLKRLQMIKDLSLTTVMECSLLDEALLFLARSRVAGARAERLCSRIGAKGCSWRDYERLIATSATCSQIYAGMIEKLQNRHRPQISAGVAIHTDGNVGVMVTQASNPSGHRAKTVVSTSAQPQARLARSQ